MVSEHSKLCPQAVDREHGVECVAQALVAMHNFHTLGLGGSL
jgi:hypothetical protein